MTKVWVPIELPDGYRVRDVIVESEGCPGSMNLRRLEPCDTITVDHPWERHIPEPQRERWEYTWSRDESALPKLGTEGWEAYAVTQTMISGNSGGCAYLFKRRLP